MDEAKFLEHNIDINRRVEEIFRSIEAQILKDALDNFAQRHDEIQALKKFIEKIRDLRDIYTGEHRDFVSRINELKRLAGLDGATAQELNKDFIGIITDLNAYEKMLEFMKLKIEELTQRLKDENNKNLVKEILEKMHESYNDYIRLNKIVIDKFRILRARIK
jgi:hypothetical protein